MAIHELLAVFCDREAAAIGRAQLIESGAPANAVRMPTDSIVIVELHSQPSAEQAHAALRAAGASEVRYSVSEDAPKWMGHITDQVTNTKVQPGQGDSEAGSS